MSVNQTTEAASSALTRIEQAFSSPDSEMRTVGGIVRETGLAQEVVETILQQHPEKFMRAGVSPPGSPVYRRATTNGLYTVKVSNDAPENRIHNGERNATAAPK